jgi:hypothetical protein
MAAVIQLGAVPQQVADESRYNIYTVIHKGLRGFMCDVLLNLGRMDVADECERGQVLQQLRGLLAMCLGHLQHENDFVHPAIAASDARVSARTAHEHVEHVEAIEALGVRITQLESADAARQAVLAQKLYLEVSAFVAENFEHMLVEETENHNALIRACTEEQVFEIEHRLVASIPPQDMMVVLRWMTSHINTSERAFLLGDIKRNAPPEVFQAVLELAREMLSQRDFYKLEKALA